MATQLSYTPSPSNLVTQVFRTIRTIMLCNSWLKSLSRIVALLLLIPSAGRADDRMIDSMFQASDEFLIFRGQDGYDLDQLSDEELIALYMDAYEDSIRRSTVDESRLVGQGRILLQLGYSYGYDRDDLDFTYQQHVYPRFQMRCRVSERLEFRTSWAGFSTDIITDERFGDSTSETRTVDPAVGLRFLLTQQDGWIPNTSITAMTPFSFDSDRSFLNRFNPQASVAYSYQVGENNYVYGSTGAIWAREGDERYLDLQQSVGVTRLLTDRWSASLDWYGVFPEGARIEGSEHYLSPGLDFSLTERTQLGVESSFGLNDLSPDVVTQFKVTWQF